MEAHLTGLFDTEIDALFEEAVSQTNGMYLKDMNGQRQQNYEMGRTDTSKPSNLMVIDERLQTCTSDITLKYNKKQTFATTNADTCASALGMSEEETTRSNYHPTTLDRRRHSKPIENTDVLQLRAQVELNTGQAEPSSPRQSLRKRKHLKCRNHADNAVGERHRRIKSGLRKPVNTPGACKQFANRTKDDVTNINMEPMMRSCRHNITSAISPDACLTSEIGDTLLKSNHQSNKRERHTSGPRCVDSQTMPDSGSNGNHACIKLKADSYGSKSHNTHLDSTAEYTKTSNETNITNSQQVIPPFIVDTSTSIHSDDTNPQTQQGNRQRHCSGSDRGHNIRTASAKVSTGTLACKRTVSYSKSSKPPHIHKYKQTTLISQANSNTKIDRNPDSVKARNSNIDISNIDTNPNSDNETEHMCMLLDSIRSPAKPISESKSCRTRRKRYCSGSDSSESGRGVEKIDSLEIKRARTKRKTSLGSKCDFEPDMNKCASPVKITIDSTDENIYVELDKRLLKDEGCSEPRTRGYQHQGSVAVPSCSISDSALCHTSARANSLSLEGDKSHNKYVEMGNDADPSCKPNTTHKYSKSIKVDVVSSDHCRHNGTTISTSRVAGRKRSCSGSCSSDVGHHSDDTSAFATKRSRSANQISSSGNNTYKSVVRQSTAMEECIKHSRTRNVKSKVPFLFDVLKAKSTKRTLSDTSVINAACVAVNTNINNKAGSISLVEKSSSLVNPKETIIQKIHQTIVEFDKPYTDESHSQTGVHGMIADINDLDTVIPLHSHTTSKTSRNTRNTSYTDPTILLRKHPVDTIWDSIMSDYYKE